MDKNKLTKAQRWQLADYLAENRLDNIDEKVKEIVPSNNIYSKYIKRLIDIVVSAFFSL